MTARAARRLVAALALAAVVPAAPALAQAPVTERASVDARGVQGNANSLTPAIAADGRSVAFQSSASNLVAGDRNEAIDLFVRDRRSGTTRRVVKRAENVLFFDGRRLAYGTESTGFFLRDLRTGRSTRLNLGADDRRVQVAFDTGVALSADGAHFAFASFEKGVVPEDRDNRTDVFVRDVAAGTTQRVSVTATGGPANGDSQDP